MSVDFGGISEADWELSALDALAGTAGYRSRARRSRRARASASRGRTSSCPPDCSTRSAGSTRSVPVESLKQAAAEIARTTSNDALTENRRTHVFMTEGFRGVSWIDHDGIEHNPTIRRHLDRAIGERLARGQPGHRPHPGVRAALRRRALLQRPAGLDHRAQAGRQRERRRRRRARPARDVRAGAADGVPVRGLHGRERRGRGALRHTVHSAQPLLAVERRR